MSIINNYLLYKFFKSFNLVFLSTKKNNNKINTNLKYNYRFIILFFIYLNT